VRGVLNLRGQLLTVIDLRCKLGLKPVAIDAQMRIMVVRREEGVVGLLVDQVEDIVEASAAEMEPPPANLGAVPGIFFSAIYKMDAELAAVLDLDQVLGK
jgi:purine-binding chemotaxis protein CheW